MQARTFCVIPYEARDNSFFLRVFEDSVAVHSDATERSSTSKGSEEVLPFSLVLSPAHQLVNQIVAPLLHAIGEGRNAFLAVALTGTASSVSEEGCEVAMELYSNLLPLLFRSAPDCTIARISVLLITPGDTPDEITVDDVLSGRAVEHGCANAQFEVVERDSSVSRWSDVLRLLSARHESKASSSSSLLVTARMEGYGSLHVLETGSHVGLLQLLSQSLTMRPLQPHGQRTSRQKYHLELLSDLMGLGGDVGPMTTAHFVVVPDPGISDRVSRRILRFVSSLRRLGSDRAEFPLHSKGLDGNSSVAPSSTSQDGGEMFRDLQDDAYRWGTELIVDPGLVAARGTSINHTKEGTSSALARTLLNNEARQNSGETHMQEVEAKAAAPRTENRNETSLPGDPEKRPIVMASTGPKNRNGVEHRNELADRHDHRETIRTGAIPAFKYDSGFQSGSRASATNPVSVSPSLGEGKGVNARGGEASLSRQPSNPSSVRRRTSASAPFDATYRDGSPAVVTVDHWNHTKSEDEDAGVAAAKSREQALLDKLMSSEYTNREISSTLAQARTELRHTIGSLEETQSALQRSQENMVEAHARTAALKSENSELSATIARLLKKVDSLEKERTENARSASAVISERDAAHGTIASKNAELKELRKKIKALEAREAQRVRQRALDALDTSRDTRGGQRSQSGSAPRARVKNPETTGLESSRAQLRSRDEAEGTLGGSLAQVIAKLREKNTQLEADKIKLKEELEYQRNLACATATSRHPRRGGGDESENGGGLTRWEEGLGFQSGTASDGPRGYRPRDEADDTAGGCGMCNTMSRKLQYFATELARARKDKDRLQEIVLASQSQRWSSPVRTEEGGAERVQNGRSGDTIMRVVSAMEAGCASLRAQLACLADEVQRSTNTQRNGSSLSTSTSLIGSEEHLKQHDSALSALEQALSEIGGKECVHVQHLPRTATAADTETLARAVDFEENRCKHLMAFIPTFMQLAVAIEHMKLRMQRP